MADLVGDAARLNQFARSANRHSTDRLVRWHRQENSSATARLEFSDLAMILIRRSDFVIRHFASHATIFVPKNPPGFFLGIGHQVC